LAGRGFDAGDFAPGSTSVIVDQAFVDLVLGGDNPLGRRVRFPNCRVDDAGCTETAPWHTIIGVVPDLTFGRGLPEASLFHPYVPGGAQHRPSLAVRVGGGEPETFAGRLRKVVAEVDPMLRLDRALSLEEMILEGQSISRLVVIVMAAIAFSVLLLAVAGLYALMSFTVVQRHREIGIRSALGADPRRVLDSVLARAMGQLALGVLIGVMLAGLTNHMLGGELLRGRSLLVLPSVVALMAAVGVAAAWGPARRGLRIQPTEALRNE
jgi:hypothetical protein